MKQVQVHWTEYRTFEFPDNAPTHDEDELNNYVENHSEAQGDWGYFCVCTETGEWKYEL